MTKVISSSEPVAVANTMRERAWSDGLASLNDTEVLALILGHGVRGCPVMTMSQHILVHVGGLGGLAEVGTARLAQIVGLGPARALRVSASAEVGRRVQLRRRAPRPLMHTAEAVARHFGPRIGAARQEQLWVLSLDGRNYLRGMRQVALGGPHRLIVTAREILSAALLDGASGFVMVHNHPSGDSHPSPADIDMTLAVARAAEVVGVPLLDHVVVSADGNYTSLLEIGVISPPVEIVQPAG